MNYHSQEQQQQRELIASKVFWRKWM